MHSSWKPIISPLKPYLEGIFSLLKGKEVLPEPKNILRVFDYSLDNVKVLLIGQDPYPTPGHAVGLSFSVSPDTKPFPRGLQNIFKEYSEDLNFPTPTTGDLASWAEQGVFLLNSCLTVAPHKPGSHVGLWQIITTATAKAIADRDRPLVSILWGRQAQSVGIAADLHRHPVIESAHPSPHTAHKGYFGSRPFSRANDLLKERGTEPIDWQLP